MFLLVSVTIHDVHLFIVKQVNVYSILLSDFHIHINSGLFNNYTLIIQFISIVHYRQSINHDIVPPSMSFSIIDFIIYM